MGYEIKNLSFSYGGHQVLNDISFRAELSELLCIIGPNGVGKTTLFKCMLGLLGGFSGEAFVCGKPIKGMKPRELARKVAYIPQSQATSFGYSVLDMVMMGVTPSMRLLSSPGRREREIAFDALQKIGLEQLAGRNYLEISGGERQLVLVARALAQRARVLIMDEPTSNLDYGNQLRVMGQMYSLAKSGYTVIMSTHSPEQAFMFADKVLALHEGRVLSFGKPSEVITEEAVKLLYGIDVELESLCGGRMRVCIPKQVLPRREAGQQNTAPEG